MKKNVGILLALVLFAFAFSLVSCTKQEKPVTDGVAETLDYGATVGRSYNKSKDMIQQINADHNRELEKALEEME